jgi:hypothetical protein
MTGGLTCTSRIDLHNVLLVRGASVIDLKEIHPSINHLMRRPAGVVRELVLEIEEQMSK